MENSTNHPVAPELLTQAWLNTAEPLSLAELKGQVVVIHAFQMLCPGCVTHGLPQANAVFEHFKQERVQVIALHAVFEHHDVMTLDALKAFVHEYRIQFPIAIDKTSVTGSIPQTMAQYQMQGTPSLIILDKDGYIRLHHFGRMHDMQVGSIIGRLLEEGDGVETSTSLESHAGECTEDGCPV